MAKEANDEVLYILIFDTRHVEKHLNTKLFFILVYLELQLCTWNISHLISSYKNCYVHCNMKLWQDFKEYKNFSNQSLLALV